MLFAHLLSCSLSSFEGQSSSSESFTVLLDRLARDRVAGGMFEPAEGGPFRED